MDNFWDFCLFACLIIFQIFFFFERRSKRVFYLLDLGFQETQVLESLCHLLVLNVLDHLADLLLQPYLYKENK